MKPPKQRHPVYSQTCDGCNREWFASKNCWKCPWCSLPARRPSWGWKGNEAECFGGHGHKTYEEAKQFQSGKTAVDEITERDILVDMEERNDFDYDRYFT